MEADLRNHRSAFRHVLRHPSLDYCCVAGNEVRYEENSIDVSHTRAGAKYYCTTNFSNDQIGFYDKGMYLH